MSKQIVELLNPTGNFYLYWFPIISSIISGLIFWLVFSYLPEKKRKKSFELGILNDLRTLNGYIFHYFDYILRHKNHTTSYFQDKIQSCSLSLKDLAIGLQNKVISNNYLYDTNVSDKFLLVGDELVKKVTEIDIVINRLYAFNYFLSPKEVSLLRSIHSNIHRYMPYIEMNFARGEFFPINPSISYVAHSAKDLQSDFKVLRKIVFSKNLKDRDFITHKILRLYHLKNYRACIKHCKKGVEKFDSDASFYKLIIISSHLFLGNKNKAYKLLESFELDNSNLISYRNIIRPMLNDSWVEIIILNKTGLAALNQLKLILKEEDDGKAHFLKQNQSLADYFSNKGDLN